MIVLNFYSIFLPGKSWNKSLPGSLVTRISTYRMNKILYNKKNLKGFRDPRQNPTAHKNLRPVYGQNTMSTMSTLKKKFHKVAISNNIRDRPFMGGGVWFFVSFRIFYFYFFCRAKREFFFQNSTLDYMTKTLNQIIFFSSTKIRIFFSATLGIRIFF